MWQDNNLPVYTTKDWKELRSWNQQIAAAKGATLMKASENEPALLLSYWQNLILMAQGSKSAKNDTKSSRDALPALYQFSKNIKIPNAKVPKLKLSQLQSVPKDLLLAGRELLGQSADNILKQAREFGVDVDQHHLHLFSFQSDDALVRLPSEFHNDPYKTNRLAGSPPGKLVVDIGANLGAFTISAFLQNPKLRILALEPMPTTFLFLKWNLQSNSIPLLTEEEFRAGHPGVLALQRAVTKDGRDVKVEYSASKTMNAITDASASFKGIPDKFAGKPQGSDQVTTTVHSLALPSFVGDEPILFLKIDCEGCEHELAPGWKASNFLSKVSMLSGEIHPCRQVPLDSCRYSPDDVKLTKALFEGRPGWA
jgi:FkbM family methyltransferase